MRGNIRTFLTNKSTLFRAANFFVVYRIAVYCKFAFKRFAPIVKVHYPAVSAEATKVFMTKIMQNMIIPTIAAKVKINFLVLIISPLKINYLNT